MMSITTTNSNNQNITKVARTINRLQRKSAAVSRGSTSAAATIISTDARQSVPELVEFFGGGKIHGGARPWPSSDASTTDSDSECESSDEDEDEDGAVITASDSDISCVDAEVASATDACEFAVVNSTTCEHAGSVIMIDNTTETDDEALVVAAFSRGQDHVEASPRPSMTKSQPGMESVQIWLVWFAVCAVSAVLLAMTRLAAIFKVTRLAATVASTSSPPSACVNTTTTTINNNNNSNNSISSSAATTTTTPSDSASIESSKSSTIIDSKLVCGNQEAEEDGEFESELASATKAGNDSQDADDEEDEEVSESELTSDSELVYGYQGEDENEDEESESELGSESELVYDSQRDGQATYADAVEEDVVAQQKDEDSKASDVCTTADVQQTEENDEEALQQEKEQTADDDAQQAGQVFYILVECNGDEETNSSKTSHRRSRKAVRAVYMEYPSTERYQRQVEGSFEIRDRAAEASLSTRSFHQQQWRS